MYKDFKTLKVGDRFVESEYGISFLCQVISKPELERPDYMVFKAKLLKSTNGRKAGEIIDYGFSYPYGAYNPKIWDEQWFNGVFYSHKEVNV